jgi:hypothetical protein
VIAIGASKRIGKLRRGRRMKVDGTPGREFSWTRNRDIDDHDDEKTAT